MRGIPGHLGTCRDAVLGQGCNASSVPLGSLYVPGTTGGRERVLSPGSEDTRALFAAQTLSGRDQQSSADPLPAPAVWVGSLSPGTPA